MASKKKICSRKQKKINDETCLEWDIESLPKFVDKVIEERTNKSIDLLIRKMEETNTKTAVIIYGGGHTRSMIQKLEEEKISYIILEPLVYEPRSNQLKLDDFLKGLFKNPKS